MNQQQRGNHNACHHWAFFITSGKDLPIRTSRPVYNISIQLRFITNTISFTSLDDLYVGLFYGNLIRFAYTNRIQRFQWRPFVENLVFTWVVRYHTFYYVLLCHACNIITVFSSFTVFSNCVLLCHARNLVTVFSVFCCHAGILIVILSTIFCYVTRMEPYSTVFYCVLLCHACNHYTKF